MSCGRCLQCKEGYQCFWGGTQWESHKILDEASPFTQEMWDKFQSYIKAQKYKTLFGYPKTVEDDELMHNWIEWQQIKKENMTKRERFLKAGGLFEKKDKEVTTTSFNLKPGDVVYIEFDDTYQAGKRNKVAFNNCQVTFKFAAVNREDKDYPNQKAHFENILSNTKSDTWIASRGREIKISNLADKHLVNIMRYLVVHWMEIKQQSLIDIDTARNNTKNSRALLNLNNAYIYVSKIMNPSGLDGTISCFANLTQEFTSRFGYDSLNSIYEGN